MKSSYRFTPKRYGYGVTPIARQGRLITLILVAVCLGSGYSHGVFQDHVTPTAIQTVGFMVDIVIIIALFLLLVKHKTDGDIKRRRGKDKTKK